MTLWFDEKIPSLSRGNWIYKIMCFLRGGKLSYKEYYMILCELNRKKMGLKEAKKASLIKVLKIYKDLHGGKMPEEAIINYDDK